MATMFYYHKADGEIVARSYKHFFDEGHRNEMWKDAVTGLHKFLATYHHNLSSPQDLMYDLERLTEKYGPLTISTCEYRG